MSRRRKSKTKVLSPPILIDAPLDELEFRIHLQPDGTTITEVLRRAPQPLQGPGEHDCWANAVPYTSDGPLGHGWECRICHAFLQAG